MNDTEDLMARANELTERIDQSSVSEQIDQSTWLSRIAIGLAVVTTLFSVVMLVLFIQASKAETESDKRSDELTQTVTVRNSAGTGTCTMIFQMGLKIGGSC